MIHPKKAQRVKAMRQQRDEEAMNIYIADIIYSSQRALATQAASKG